MLVITRKRGESIVIHDDIIITVVDIPGHKVRLGIEAPRNIPVHRQEIQAGIKKLRPSGEETRVRGAR